MKDFPKQPKPSALKIESAKIVLINVQNSITHVR